MTTINDTVTVNMTGADGKTQAFTKPVSFPELETADDVLGMLSDDAKLNDLIAAANYGFNLKARAKVSQQIKQENAGPENSINKVVKDLVKMFAAMGQVITEDEARAKVLALNPAK
jgi:uncharacterized protein YdbL (DUF1318 family)